MQLSAIALRITASSTEFNISFKKWKSGPMTINWGQLGGTHAKPPVHPAANPPAKTSMYSSQAVSSEFWLAKVRALRKGVKMKMPKGPPRAPASTRGVSGSLKEDAPLLRQQRPKKLRDLVSGPWKTGAELMAPELNLYYLCFASLLEAWTSAGKPPAFRYQSSHMQMMRACFNTKSNFQQLHEPETSTNMAKSGNLTPFALPHLRQPSQLSCILVLTETAGVVMAPRFSSSGYSPGPESTESFGMRCFLPSGNQTGQWKITSIDSFPRKPSLIEYFQLPCLITGRINCIAQPRDLHRKTLTNELLVWKKLRVCFQHGNYGKDSYSYCFHLAAMNCDIWETRRYVLRTHLILKTTS